MILLDVEEQRPAINLGWEHIGQDQIGSGSRVKQIYRCSPVRCFSTIEPGGEEERDKDVPKDLLVFNQENARQREAYSSGMQSSPSPTSRRPSEN